MFKFTPKCCCGGGYQCGSYAGDQYHFGIDNTSVGGSDGMPDYFTDLSNLVGYYKDIAYQTLYKLKYDVTKRDYWHSDYAEQVLPAIDCAVDTHFGYYQNVLDGVGPVDSSIVTSNSAGWTLSAYKNCSPERYWLHEYSAKILPWTQITIEGAQPWICPFYVNGDITRRDVGKYALLLDITFSSAGATIVPASYLKKVNGSNLGEPYSDFTGTYQYNPVLFGLFTGVDLGFPASQGGTQSQRFREFDIPPDQDILYSPLRVIIDYLATRNIYSGVDYRMVQSDFYVDESQNATIEDRSFAEFTRAGCRVYWYDGQPAYPYDFYSWTPSPFQINQRPIDSLNISNNPFGTPPYLTGKVQQAVDYGLEFKTRLYFAKPLEYNSQTDAQEYHGLTYVEALRICNAFANNQHTFDISPYFGALDESIMTDGEFLNTGGHQSAYEQYLPMCLKLYYAFLSEVYI